MEKTSVPPLVSYLRCSLPIRNRQHLKRLFKCCFVGSEAVSLIVSSGWSSTRAGAVAIGEVLRKLGYIRHVTDGHSFKDGFLYYRFFSDENATYKAGHHAKIKPLSSLGGRELSLVVAEGRGGVEEESTTAVHGHEYNFTPTNLSPTNAGRGDQLIKDIESR